MHICDRTGVWQASWGWGLRLERYSQLTVSALVRPVNITEPTVKLLHSSCNPSAFHSTIQLYCFIYGHIQDDVTVVWLKDGQDIPNVFPNFFLIKKEGKLASTYSVINITQQQWASESTFTCQVTSQGETYMAFAQKCPGRPSRGWCPDLRVLREEQGLT